uniref:Uncharacterized protein n=2 Tax=Graphocephala atropunctata TaxID=36148 RepID=A0A1B6M9L9_9HEMI
MEREVKWNTLRKPFGTGVQSERDNSNPSFDEKFDHLSYSYSCVKAFKDNKAIIGNLATLHEAQYQGLLHQPALYSLSGERGRPVCPPFYYNTSLEADPTSQPEYSDNVYTVESLHRGPKTAESEVFLEQEFFNKKLFLQWLRYQFKYVNSLWPYIKESILPKVCRKYQKMKMEMLLNEMDEGAKFKLKEYMKRLNLNFQERCNLCNESVIEIDITPLMEDSNRLQAFLEFLHSIESKESRVKSDNDMCRSKNCVSFGNGARFKNTVYKSKLLQGYDLLHPNKSTKIQTAAEKQTRISSSHCQSKRNIKFETPSIESIEHLNFVEPTRDRAIPTKSNRDQNYYLGCPNLNYPERDKPNDWINQYEMYNNHTSDEITSFSDPARPHRTSILAKKQPTNRSPDNNQDAEAKRDNTRLQNNFYAQNNPLYIPENSCTNESETNKFECKNYSCKCLLRQTHNDYKRCKEQYLFGKGDEDSSNLLKYIANRQINSKPKISPLNSKNTNLFIQIRTEKKPPKENTCQEVKNNCIGQNNEEFENILSKENNVDPTRKSNSHPIIKSDLVMKSDAYKALDISSIKPINISHDYKYISSQKRQLHKKSTRLSGKKGLTTKNSEIEKARAIFNKNPATSDQTSDSIVEHSQDYDRFRTVRVEDIEKLICAINYSNDSFCGEKRNEMNQNRDKNNTGKCQQFSINACYESLNYSIDSCALNKNNSEIESISTFESQPSDSSPSTNSNNKTDSISFSSSYSNSEQSGKSNYFIQNNTSQNKTKGTRTDQKQMNYENLAMTQNNNKCIMSKYHGQKDCSSNKHKEIKNSNCYDQLTKLNKGNCYDAMNSGDGQVMYCMEDANDRDNFNLNKIINRTLKNNNDIEFYECECDHNHDMSNSENPLLLPQIVDMMMKINPENPEGKDINMSKTTKKPLKLNSFKPKNLYRSISSIFRKNSGHQHEQSLHNLRENTPRNNTNNCEEKKTVKDCRRVKHFLIQTQNRCGLRNTSRDERTAFNGVLGTDTSLILENLHKLFEEVRNHRGEIDVMKKYLHNHIN